MDKETIVQLLADGVISNEVAARYFPELKENEDEKVKKELINAINLAYDCGIAITKENRDKYLAWIEKQGDVIPYVEKLGKQGEPTEINSEFDSQLNRLLEKFKSLPKEELASSLSFYLNVVQNDGTYKIEDEPNVCEGCNNAKGCVTCVDGSEWAHIEEAKSFWSEEDIFKVQRICKYLDEVKKYYVDITEVRECMDWLKSLEDRMQPQSTWKPSDEQMRELGVVATGKGLFSKEVLSGLLEQLKKLKEE